MKTDTHLCYPIARLFQVQQFCAAVKQIPQLANGFNLIGFSQGKQR